MLWAQVGELQPAEAQAPTRRGSYMPRENPVASMPTARKEPSASDYQTLPSQSIPGESRQPQAEAARREVIKILIMQVVFDC